MLATVAAQFTVWRAPSLATPTTLALVGGLFLGAPALVYIDSKSLLPLLAATVLRGVGFGVLTVALTAQVSGIATGSSQGRAIGRFGLVTGMAAVVCGPLGLFLWARYREGTFMLGGLLPILGAFLALAPAARSATAHWTRPQSRGAPGAFAAVIGFFAGSLAYSAALTLLPVYNSQMAVGAVLTVALCMTVSRWAIGYLVDRGGVSGYFLCGVLMAGIGVFALAWFDRAGYIGAAALLGVGFGLASTASFLLITRNYVKGDLAPSAIWNIVFDSGLGIGGLATAALSTRYGYGVVLQIVGVVAILTPALLTLGSRGMRLGRWHVHP